MLTAGTRLGASHATLMTILRAAPELREGPELTQILELLRERRAMDLSDLPPAEQASLIAARTQELLPSADNLAERLAAASTGNRKLIVKFGIDPTAADVHVGHAVPMIIAGMRIGLGRALHGVVLGEMFSSNAGLGYRITFYAAHLRTADVFVPLVILVVIGLLINQLGNAVEARLQAWRA